MTLSTCSTVSAEEVKRFAAEMAHELGIADRLQMESWANPYLTSVPLPEGPLELRNPPMRLRIGGRTSDDP